MADLHRHSTADGSKREINLPVDGVIRANQRHIGKPTCKQALHQTTRDELELAEEDLAEVELVSASEGVLPSQKRSDKEL